MISTDQVGGAFALYVHVQMTRIIWHSHKLLPLRQPEKHIERPCEHTAYGITSADIIPSCVHKLLVGHFPPPLTAPPPPQTTPPPPIFLISTAYPVCQLHLAE